ncbi:hypothetical protein IF2G_03015 [Cordyceps javanica]|nr:hypothetical protein IF2G_03015 [Cordyceps javanica]
MVPGATTSDNFSWVRDIVPQSRLHSDSPTTKQVLGAPTAGSPGARSSIAPRVSQEEVSSCNLPLTITDANRKPLTPLLPKAANAELARGDCEPKAASRWKLPTARAQCDSVREYYASCEAKTLDSVFLVLPGGFRVQCDEARPKWISQKSKISKGGHLSLPRTFSWTLPSKPCCLFDTTNLPGADVDIAQGTNVSVHFQHIEEVIMLFPKMDESWWALFDNDPVLDDSGSGRGRPPPTS